MDTKAGVIEGAGPGKLVQELVQQAGHALPRAGEPPPASFGAECPSVVDVACFESGDLSDVRHAAIVAHSRQCFRCGLSLAELRQARNEILGTTPSARTVRSQRAAEEIERLLRRRVH